MIIGQYTHNNPKVLDRQLWANSVDSDQTAPEHVDSDQTAHEHVDSDQTAHEQAQFDQGLYCLQFHQHCLDALLSAKTNLFEF